MLTVLLSSASFLEMPPASATYARVGFCRRMSSGWAQYFRISADIHIYKIRPVGIEPATYGLEDRRSNRRAKGVIKILRPAESDSRI